MEAKPLYLVLALLGAVLLAGREAAAQSVIDLRAAAKATPGSAVTLAQIATLTGAEALALAHIRIPDLPISGQKAVSTQEVRRALDAQGRVNWGRITLRGSKCTISATQDAPAKPALAKVAE